MEFFQQKKYSKEVKNLLFKALENASAQHHEYLGKYHVLFALLENEGELSRLYQVLEVDIQSAKMYCDKKFHSLKRITSDAETTQAPEIEVILKGAQRVRRKLQDELFYPIHILLAILKIDGEEFKKFNLDYDAIYGAYVEQIPPGGNKQNPNRIGKERNDSLAKYCKNITVEAVNGQLEPLIGRDKELREIYEVLGRKNKRNIILKGEPGVGKSTLINGLAQAIGNELVPDFLKKTNLLVIDVGALLAGASYRGELEGRIKKILEELKNVENPVLFIDEIHMLVDKEGSIGGGLVNMLKPELANGKLTVIGATTNNEYRKHIEKDKAFRRRFALIDVEEPTESEAVHILKEILQAYEVFHDLKTDDSFAKEVVVLAKRYLKEQMLPDSAIDLADRTFSAVKTTINTTAQTLTRIKNMLSKEKGKKDNVENLELIQVLLKEKINPFIYQQLKSNEILEKGLPIDLYKIIEMQIKEIATIVKNKKDNKTVTGEDVSAMISVITKIPIGKIQSSEKERLTNIEKEMKKRVIGQDHALTLVADSIRQFRTGLEEPGKPASFFLLGPTGTGKTELAKTLSEFLFDNQDSLLRFDMSEYRSEQSGELLLGAPPGYVGYDEGGILVNKIREKPFSVVLFDEIEKAHKSIYRIFLQVLDEGKITDRQNRVGDFSNAIILFTSNLGEEVITKYVYEKKALPSSKELEDLLLNDEYWNGRGQSPPYSKEFLARITTLIPFSPITSEMSIKILQIQLNKFIKQLSGRGIKIDITDNAIQQLLKEGYNPAMGARPLKNVIRSRIRSPIANLLVSKEETNFSVSIDYKEKKKEWIVV